MKQLPDPLIYEKENTYFPWGKTINLVLDLVIKKTPRGGTLIDLCCGPGFLLGKIAAARNDIILEGVDTDTRYISYAKKQYPSCTFIHQDVLYFKTQKKYDVITCTAGIHHLPYDTQESFIQSIPLLLKAGGLFIAADPYIDEYVTEMERKRSAAKLGYEYVLANMDLLAPDDIVKAALDIMYNDVLGFEYKTSLKKLEQIFRKTFTDVKVHKLWPQEKTNYGDYCIVCKV